MVQSNHNALGSLLPPPPPGTPGPFALSVDGALEALVAEADMRPGKLEEFDCPWAYPDERTLLRGLLSPGPGIRAVQLAGEAAARDAFVLAVASGQADALSGCYLSVDDDLEALVAQAETIQREARLRLSLRI